MKRLTIPFDLIVTTVAGRDLLAAAVVREFPDAELVVTENRGRDVRPFLELLEAGRLDRYRYVCKIHGKKSNDGGRISYLGALWRRRSLFDLLAGPGIAESIVHAFEADPSLGIIGPRAFRLPSKTSPLEPSWGKTRPKVLELAAKMGVAPDEFRLDFYGGTMFWVRPEALRPLRDLKLACAFPEEQGLLDGGLEHATERLFTTSAVVVGFKLADSDGYEVTQAAMKDPEARNSSHSRRLSTLPLSQKDAGAPGGFEETDPVLAADRHPQACDAGRRRRAHIGVAVPDKHSLIRSEAQIPHRHFHHSWRRLAAIAAVVGAVRTNVDRLKPQPFRRQHGAKPSMNLLEPCDVEVPARDPRLICDQDKRKSGVPQQLQPFNCARRKLDSLRIGQVDSVDDDRSVAIDKRDPPRS